MRQAHRIILNTISNYALSAVQIVASLVLVPTLVAHLTKSGYGMATLATVVWTGAQLFSNSIGRAMQRYIPLNLSRSDTEGYRRTFNTSLAGYLLLGVVSALVVYFIRDWLLDDPTVSSMLMADVKRAFLVVCAWLVVGLAGSAYVKGLESIQRFDLTGLYVGTATVVRTLLVIAVFKLNYGSITFLVTTDMISSIVSSLLCRRALKRLVPATTESVRMLDRQVARTLLAFAGATLLIIIGNVAGAHGFRIFVAKRLGMDALGGLAAILTITALMWRLINDLSNVLAPAVSSLESSGSMSNVSKLLVSGTKYAVVVSVTICLVPIAVAAPFFHLWLGDEFAGMNTLIHVLLIAHVPLCLNPTAQQVLIGLAKLRVLGIIMCVRGVLGLILAIAFVTVVRPSLTGAAACLYGTQVVADFLVFSLACEATGTPVLRSLRSVLGRPLALGVVGAMITWAAARGIGADEWWRIAISVFFGELVFAGSVAFLGLSGEERARVRSFAASARQRLLPARTS